MDEGTGIDLVKILLQTHFYCLDHKAVLHFVQFSSQDCAVVLLDGACNDLVDELDNIEYQKDII